MDLFRLLWRRAPGPLVVGVLAGLLGAAMNMLLLHRVRTLIEVGSADLGRLAPVALAFAAQVAILLSLVHFSRALVERQAHAVVTELRADLALRLTQIPFTRTEELGPARLHHALSSEVAELGLGIMALPQTLLYLAVLLIALGYLATVALPAFLLTLAGLVLAVLVRLLRTPIVRRDSAEAAGVLGELQADFGAIIDGSVELRLHHGRRTTFLRDDLRPAIERAREVILRHKAMNRAFATITSALVWLTIGLVVVLAPRISASSASMVVVLLYVLAPYDGFVSGVELVTHGDAALQRLQRLMATLPGVDPAGGAPPAFTRAITLRAVEHTYADARGDHFRLGPLDLEIRKGQLLMLIGGNGSGKTTLGKLLCGLYAPQRGTLLVDDVTVDDALRPAYANLYSAIFSRFHVFPALLDVAHEARALSLLEELGLAGIVELEGGRFRYSELSSGQKKRLALVVAMLDDRPCLLLDEWAADQDPDWKRMFYRTLLPRLRDAGKTIIVITHDDSYFEVADRVVKLESGQLVPYRPSA